MPRTLWALKGLWTVMVAVQIFTVLSTRREVSVILIMPKMASGAALVVAVHKVVAREGANIREVQLVCLGDSDNIPVGIICADVLSVEVQPVGDVAHCSRILVRMVEEALARGVPVVVVGAHAFTASGRALATVMAMDGVKVVGIPG